MCHLARPAIARIPSYLSRIIRRCRRWSYRQRGNRSMTCAREPLLHAPLSCAINKDRPCEVRVSRSKGNTHGIWERHDCRMIGEHCTASSALTQQRRWRRAHAPTHSACITQYQHDNYTIPSSRSSSATPAAPSYTKATSGRADLTRTPPRTLHAREWVLTTFCTHRLSCHETARMVIRNDSPNTCIPVQPETNSTTKHRTRKHIHGITLVRSKSAWYQNCTAAYPWPIVHSSQ